MFYSILFPSREQYEKPRRSGPPACSKDLNLRHIFIPILKATVKHNLNDLFYTPLQDQDIITYRQDIMRELEHDKVRSLISNFSKTILAIKDFLDKLRSVLPREDPWTGNYLAQGQALDCVEKYCRAVSTLAAEMAKLSLSSAGLGNFRKYLQDYCKSADFSGLCADAQKLREQFSKVQYCLLIRKYRIRVRKYEEQVDHSKQIVATFAKFKQEDATDYRREFSEAPSSSHVENSILKKLAKLYKDMFAELYNFCKKYFPFGDRTILRFSQEIHFYLAWLDYIKPLQEVGLSFNYPKICSTPKHLYSRDSFDLALAADRQGKIVSNDFELNAPEQVIVVTGPNQGGKTTFARAFGQMHYLASLGLCVPGSEAALYHFDKILTHFCRADNLTTLSGKLQNDLLRFHELLTKATDRSIIIVNEIFSSTMLADALTLGGHLLDAVLGITAPTVIVTFLDELATHSPATVSMMSMVNIDDPAERTFKVVRKPPDGLAYALYIAKKHGLTYEQLSGRLKE